MLQDFNERLSAYEGLIRAVSLERGIKHAIGIAVDEWGVSRFPSDSPDLRQEMSHQYHSDELGIMRLPESSRDVPRDRGRMIINLEDALVTGLYLNSFIRHASSVRMANFTPMLTIDRD